MAQNTSYVPFLPSRLSLMETYRACTRILNENNISGIDVDIQLYDRIGSPILPYQYTIIHIPQNFPVSTFGETVPVSGHIVSMYHDGTHVYLFDSAKQVTLQKYPKLSILAPYVLYPIRYRIQKEGTFTCGNYVVFALYCYVKAINIGDVFHRGEGGTQEYEDNEATVTFFTFYYHIGEEWDVENAMCFPNLHRFSEYTKTHQFIES